jgi:hypothetical protein
MDQSSDFRQVIFLGKIRFQKLHFELANGVTAAWVFHPWNK